VERVMLCVCRWVGLSSTLVTATRSACWHSVVSCGEGHAVYPCVSVCLSVGRFVKYTGYGNAAGLLAQRGLMCGGHGAIYSSESEDSETEEYSQLKDRYCRLCHCHTGC